MTKQKMWTHVAAALALKPPPPRARAHAVIPRCHVGPPGKTRVLLDDVPVIRWAASVLALQLITITVLCLGAGLPFILAAVYAGQSV